MHRVGLIAATVVVSTLGGCASDARSATTPATVSAVTTATTANTGTASTTGTAAAPSTIAFTTSTRTDPAAATTVTSAAPPSTTSTTSTNAPTATAATAPATTATSENTATSATTGPSPRSGPSAAGDVRTLGTSVQGRPITALHRGTPGGHVVVVIGVIHGDETAGLGITSRLATMAVPDDIDLWIVDSMNPDGQAANDRHNADQVDLNRNFPYQWAPFESPGGSEYAGPSAASEPETKAMVSFISDVHPEMVIWYHQDLDRIAPSTGRDGRIRARYAELTGVPLLNITGGHYTGVAATWARHELDGGVAFIVELGPSLDARQADVHAAAVLTVAGEL